MVRAKFKCDQVRVSEGYVYFHPVYSGSEENKKFFAATPGGEIRLQIVNEEALKYFEEGKEYYIDFKKAGEPD